MKKTLSAIVHEEQLAEAMDLLGQGIELPYVKWDGCIEEWN